MPANRWVRQICPLRWARKTRAVRDAEDGVQHIWSRFGCRRPKPFAIRLAASRTRRLVICCIALPVVLAPVRRVPTSRVQGPKSSPSSGLVGIRLPGAADPRFVASRYLAGRRAPIDPAVTDGPEPPLVGIDGVDVGTRCRSFKACQRTIVVTGLRQFVVRASYIQSVCVRRSAVRPISDPPSPLGTSGLRQNATFTVKAISHRRLSATKNTLLRKTAGRRTQRPRLRSSSVAARHVD